MAYGCAYLGMPEYGRNNRRSVDFLILLGVIVNFPDNYQILRIAFWAAITILFAAPLEILHLLLEFLHLLFEWTEAALDFMIELVFDTSLHTTQVIVFYIIIAAILYGLYRLWRGLPDFYRRQKIYVNDFLFDETQTILNYWRTSITNKIMLLTAATGLIFLLLI
jgi:hypothetical protein